MGLETSVILYMSNSNTKRQCQNERSLRRIIGRSLVVLGAERMLVYKSKWYDRQDKWEVSIQRTTRRTRTCKQYKHFGRTSATHKLLAKNPIAGAHQEEEDLGCCSRSAS